MVPNTQYQHTYIGGVLGHKNKQVALKKGKRVRVVERSTDGLSSDNELVWQQGQG